LPCNHGSVQDAVTEAPPAPPIADQNAIENILLYVDPISNETSPLNTHYQADIIYD
jgi:hypothetical protein